MMPTGFVYFLRSGNTDNYKIGLTNNLDRRLKELNSGQAPYPITLQWSIAVKDTHTAERELHDRFSQNRRHGEWFEFTDAELSEVNRAYGEVAGRYPNIPVFKAPIEVPQYAPKYYPQSPQPDFRSLDRDSHIPWLGLIVAGAIAVWVGGFIKVDPTAPKTWKMPNGPSITLPSMPDFKMPSIAPTPQTIVVQRRANVRSSPNGKILCQAEPNEQLRAIGSSDGWTKVKACGGEGFVFSKLVN